jgi:hypothetical protein
MFDNIHVGGVGFEFGARQGAPFQLLKGAPLVGAWRRSHKIFFSVSFQKSLI